MKYGFVIDNRKCIGCHACTVACKSEHDVAIGVNRTWVKQVEKGQFPNTRRVFSVMRCNHCTDAPCVNICPTQALFTREDGIVDFDNSACIGCKSCIQACPYDALYIDPKTSTAAKCNYCAHRVDIGLEPACVNVCPEHAIISGDMDDIDSEIAQLLAREQVTVRKSEKGTKPNVYYINGDQDSLNPTATSISDQYMWSSQSQGVGHYAKYAENRLAEGADIVQMAAQLSGREMNIAPDDANKKSVEVIMQGKSKRVSDQPSKGLLWGKEVTAYVWTKAIASGAFLLPFLAWLWTGGINTHSLWVGSTVGIIFLTLTGLLLIKDLDQPSRFLYVLLKPQWGSWLVKGGYAITFFGASMALVLLSIILDSEILRQIGLYSGAFFGTITAIYTAFLFAQAKGRDFWQSPVLALHMLIHSLLAGAAVFAIATVLGLNPSGWSETVPFFFKFGILFNLVILALELGMPHPTADAQRVSKMILKGEYKNYFWIGSILIGNIIPLLLILFGGGGIMTAIAGVLLLIGMYCTEHIWVEAPQRIPLA